MSDDTPFPIRKTPDLPRINAEVLERWRRDDVFRQTLSLRETAKPWVFYEGPPSANGLPGIHHVIGRALKDLYCRYKTQCGYKVERRAGWDTHGLPVELNVEKALGITKEEIGKSVSVEQYNAECRKAVMRYSALWRELTERVGYWVDMDHPYVTFDAKYIESVWWLLSRLFEQGNLYRGYTVQPYSPMAGTGLSSHELNQPGAYREVTDLSATVMFAVKTSAQQQAASAAARRAPISFPSPALQQAADAGQLYILAWTTTPWTLPSNTALAVHPKLTYCVVETTHQRTREPVSLIVAEGLLDAVFTPDQYLCAEPGAELTWGAGPKEKIPYRVKERLVGASLIGIWYDQLLPWVLPAEQPEQAFRVVGGDFVTLEDGTGVVHIAPTFGADDARVAKAASIPAMRVHDAEGNLVPLVDQRGRFVPQTGELAGQYVKAAYYPEQAQARNVDEEIVVGLKRAGRLFRSAKYQHSYPHCWRTDAPIIYYPLDSWFVQTTAHKAQLIELNRSIKWQPESTGTGRFGQWLENLSDWNLSRSRFWGIPLPVWLSEDGTETKCIGSYEQLKQEIAKSIESGVMQEDPFAEFVPGNMTQDNYDKIDVHRPFIDRVKLVSDSGQVLTRSPDVIDVWFDSGAMPYAQVHYPFENREAIDGRREFPARFIAEGVDQTRGWFFTLHAIATMVFGSVAFESVLSNGLVLDAEGRKMSKRLGNAVDPLELLDKYGADPIRWYMVTNSPPWLNLRFDVDGVDEGVRKFFGTLWSTYSFFATYANADGFVGNEPAVPVHKRPELDRWILSELHATLATVRGNLDAFDATRAYRAVHSFLLDCLSNWYVRLNRRRFWKSEMGEDKLAAYQTAYECLVTLSKVIAPVAPFHAEQLYADLTIRCPQESSVHLTDFPEVHSELIDETLNERMRLTRRAASLALSLRKDKGIKVRQPLAKLTLISNADFGASLDSLTALLREDVNVKEVVLADPESGLIQRSAQLDFRAAGPRFGKQTQKVAAAVKALSPEQLLALSAGQSLQIQVEGEATELPADLVKLSVQGKPGAELASDAGLTVLLDTTLTDELKLEGFARELVSSIQRLRKESQFDVTTRIRLTAARHPRLEQVLDKHSAYICAETLCQDIELRDRLDVPETLVDGLALRMLVSALTS